MPSLKRLQQRFQGIQNVRQPVRAKLHALMGHPDGSTIDDPENAAFVFVRIDGNSNRTERALCREVLRRYNQKVIVAYSDELPSTLEIIKLDKDAFPPAAGGSSSYDGSAQLGNHALQHAMYGGDTVWIQTKQILAMRTRPAVPASMRVYVESGAYQYQSGFNYWPGAYSSDMTAHIPATANTQLYRVVYINAATNALGYVNTATMAADAYLSNFEAVLDLIPTGSVPLAAVRLYNGQTTIAEAQIYDLRSFVSSAPGTVTGLGSQWANVKTVALSGGDYTSIQSAINAVSSGTLILVAPGGTYAENVTLKDGVGLASMGMSLLTTIAPAAGVPVSVPAGVHRLWKFHLTPPAGQVAISVTGATGDVEIFKCYVGANGADSISAPSAGAAFSVLLSETTVAGGITTKAILNALDCDITGNVTQSTSAGNLTLRDSVLTGNLTHVAGATVNLHGLPTITGVISGGGTVIGSWLDAAGNLNPTAPVYVILAAQIFGG